MVKVKAPLFNNDVNNDLEHSFALIMREWQQQVNPDLLLRDDQGPCYVVGFSGGPDSVALLLLLKQVQATGLKPFKLIAAHLNHGWRETASRDEDFCRAFCQQHNIQLEVAYADRIAIDERKIAGSREQEGRLKRRVFFSECQKKYGASVVILGHHADDQRETFFIRLARGSSLAGLSCMKMWDKPYFRPLLSFPKKELLTYCQQRNATFCYDESNDSADYLRNRVRLQIMPVLACVDNRFEDNLLKSIGQLQADNDLLETITRDYFNKIFIWTEKGFIGSRESFSQLPVRLQQRLVLSWLIQEKASFSCSLALVEEIIRFLCSCGGGRHQLAQGWSIRKKQKLFWIEHHLV